MHRIWEQPLPVSLYKYLKPDRIDALTTARIRFSQRTAFSDDHELLPDFERFGTYDEIWRFQANTGMALDPANPAHVRLVRFLADSVDAQSRMLQTTRKNMRSLDEFGILCLTECPDSPDMWEDYADNGHGFVIAFDTTHMSFGLLREPGRIGRVEYSDLAYESFLGLIETDVTQTFFRKRMPYAFEREWRSIRALRRLENNGADMYFSRFDPATVSRLFTLPTCGVTAQLHQLVATDARYAHVDIVEQRI
jgi:hypothetical protein